MFLQMPYLSRNFQKSPYNTCHLQTLALGVILGHHENNLKAKFLEKNGHQLSKESKTVTTVLKIQKIKKKKKIKKIVNLEANEWPNSYIVRSRKDLTNSEPTILKAAHQLCNMASDVLAQRFIEFLPMAIYGGCELHWAWWFINQVGLIEMSEASHHFP